jgi:hypothetical protein
MNQDYDEYDDYPTRRLAPFSCTMCGSWDWPDPDSRCPLCRGHEDEDEEETETENNNEEQ